MWGPLGRFVDLREGEGIPALQTAAILYLIIAAHTMLETARDALFLEKLPASQLAFVYAALAVFSFFAVQITERFVRRFGRRNAFIFSLMTAAYGTTVLYLLPDSIATVYGLYLWTGLLGTILVVQFWLLAGSLFTVAQGKRLFGPLAAGGVLGAVSGAATAAAALRFVPIHELVVVAAAIFLATALVLSTVDTEAVVALPSAPEKKKRTRELEVFRGQPYLRKVAGMLVAVTAMTLMTDYLFKSVAAQSMPKADLGEFFAQYYAVLNTVSFFVQVSLAGYIVRRVGVVSAVTVMPGLVLLSGLASAVSGGRLWGAMATKTVDGSLRHSLHRVSTELLWMPVATRLRERAKSFVDSTLLRFTQAGIAGLILIMTTMGYEDPRWFAGFIVVFAALAAGIGMSLRRPYLDLFRDALSSEDRGRLDFELDLRSVEVVVEALSSLDPARVVAALDLLDVQDKSRLIPSLILYHDSEIVLLRAMEVISIAERRDWVPLTKRLLEHNSQEVRAGAVRALAKNGHAKDMIEERLQDISPSVRAHAAYWLVQHAKDELPPDKDARIRGLLDLKGPAGVMAQRALVDAISDGGDDAWSSVLLQLACSEDSNVSEHASLAMQNIRDPRFIPILIERLGMRDGRSAVRSAIQAQGEKAQVALEAAMRNPATDARVRLHIPQSIRRLGNQRAADFLVEQLDVEVNRRVAFKLLRSIERLVTDEPVHIDTQHMERELQRNLVRYFEILAMKNLVAPEWSSLEGPARQSGALLVNLLDDKLDQAIGRAFIVLKIIHRHEDIRGVQAALSSEDKRRRAQAAEFLDGISMSSTSKEGAANRDLIRVYVDDLAPEEKVSRIRSLLGKIPVTPDEALISLMNEDHDAVASIATYHALNLERPSLHGEIQRITKSRPKLVSAEMESFIGH